VLPLTGVEALVPLAVDALLVPPVVIRAQTVVSWCSLLDGVDTRMREP
jgi:hypothetical protein